MQFSYTIFVFLASGFLFQGVLKNVRTFDSQFELEVDYALQSPGATPFLRLKIGADKP